MKLLITGRPGIGKTTILRRLSLKFRDLKPSGFYTEEIRERGIRKGFVIKRVDGSMAGILAGVDIKSPYRVGKYGVDIEAFEKFLSESEGEILASAVVLIDEIGKMECYSKRFMELIEKLLSTDRLLIATIAEKGTGFIEALKKRDGIQIIYITEQNRDAVVEELAETVMSRFKNDLNNNPDSPV
ncbi:MAG: NTPase [Thermodesulfovibrionales bacterium]|nr:NTPase [Thermodesulfovibrionales bacterium]